MSKSLFLLCLFFCQFCCYKLWENFPPLEQRFLQQICVEIKFPHFPCNSRFWRWAGPRGWWGRPFLGLPSEVWGGAEGYWFRSPAGFRCQIGPTWWHRSSHWHDMLPRTRPASPTTTSSHRGEETTVLTWKTEYLFGNKNHVKKTNKKLSVKYILISALILYGAIFN